jgi:formylglycine-generating enzyme required for sulfatase activity
VDRTEVTNADYARFLAALDGGLPDVLIPPVCGWNVSLVPSGAWPNDAGSLPVRFVDWCDAFTYCRARGKRLCGRPDGGPGDYNETLASGSEWLAACQGGAGRAFPYGTAYVAGACNDLSFDAGAPAPVGSLPGCEGGFAGVMDMAGNVGEWENACTAGGDPRLNGCRVRGGSYQTTSAGCASPGAADRALSYAHVGFRCCAP